VERLEGVRGMEEWRNGVDPLRTVASGEWDTGRMS